MALDRSPDLCNEIYSATIATFTLYRLHFGSNINESLSEHSSVSYIGQVRNWAI